MPDYFVPLDTMKYTRLHRELAAKSVIITENLKFVDKERKKLQRRYESFADFKDNFDVPQSLINKIMAEGEKKNIKPKDNDELQRTLPYLKTQLKALIARDLWSMSEYFSISNLNNDIYIDAVNNLDTRQ